MRAHDASRATQQVSEDKYSLASIPRVLDLNIPARELNLYSVVKNSISSSTHATRSSAVPDKLLEKRQFKDLHSFSLPRSYDTRIHVRSQRASHKTLDLSFVSEQDSDLFIVLLRPLLPPVATGVEYASRSRQVHFERQEQIGPNGEGSQWLRTRADQPTHLFTVSPHFSTMAGQKTLSEFKIEIRAREGGKHKSLCPPNSRTPNYAPQQLQHIQTEEHRVPHFVIKETEKQVRKAQRAHALDQLLKQEAEKKAAENGDGGSESSANDPRKVKMAMKVEEEKQRREQIEIQEHAHLHLYTHLKRWENVYQNQRIERREEGFSLVDRIEAYRVAMQLDPRKGLEEEEIFQAAKTDYAEKQVILSESACRGQVQADQDLRKAKIKEMLSNFEGMPVTPADWQEFEMSFAELLEQRRVQNTAHLAREQFINVLHRVHQPECAEGQMTEEEHCAALVAQRIARNDPVSRKQRHKLDRKRKLLNEERPEGVYHAHPLLFPLPVKVQERLRRERHAMEAIERRRQEMGKERREVEERKQALENEKAQREGIDKASRHLSQVRESLLHAPAGPRMVATMAEGFMSLANPPPQGYKVFLMANTTGYPEIGLRQNQLFLVTRVKEASEEDRANSGFLGLLAGEAKNVIDLKPPTHKFAIDDAHAGHLLGFGAFSSSNVVEVDKGVARALLP